MILFLGFFWGYDDVVLDGGGFGVVRESLFEMVVLFFGTAGGVCMFFDCVGVFFF